MNKIIRIKERWRYLGLFLTVSIALLTAAYFGFSEFSRYSMKAMNCKTLPPEEFNSRLADRMSRPLYTPKRNQPTKPVYFQFNLSSALMEDAMLVIESFKAAGAVYRAPYQAQFTIHAGEELLKDDGYDNFKFIFLNKKTHEICVAVHEAAPFWQPQKKIHLNLLPERELDPKTGLPVAFKVYAE